MLVKEIRVLAEGLGITPGKMKKANLIKAIQISEGNFPCFETAEGSCDQADCRWREDCLK
ncbi:MAG: hypothetical protein JEY91_15135 [Spirochaetaceae bacterium]|nr:hypothetical protein [Spirochaetaceae bacterium]